MPQHYSVNPGIVLSQEDVSRHNAFDEAVRDASPSNGYRTKDNLFVRGELVGISGKSDSC